MDRIRMIGVRMDLGAGRRGVDMGPSAMRKAGIRRRLSELDYEVIDDGNLNSEEPESLPIDDPQLKYLPQIAAVMEDLAGRVSKSLSQGEIPLVLGGDHSIAIGTIGGLAGYYRRLKKKVGMIWLDAHGDSNTPETSPSGNIHGMPQAIAFGRGASELVRIGGFEPGESKLDPACCSIVGARSIDRREKEVLADIGLRIFTMEEIDRRGIYAVSREAIEIASRDTEGIHVSFDVDVIDPTAAPGVGTPVMGGLTYRETHTLMEAIAESEQMVAMEVAEVNPILDVRNQTAEVAVDMVASAFGKRIL